YHRLLRPHLLYQIHCVQLYVLCCFFTYPAPTMIYTLSLHDALPIYDATNVLFTHKTFLDKNNSVYERYCRKVCERCGSLPVKQVDRKSTRLNSSHVSISYAVFCLKKKNTRYIELFII